MVSNGPAAWLWSSGGAPAALLLDQLALFGYFRYLVNYLARFGFDLAWLLLR